MTFGLTPQGFNAMRLADVLQQQNDAFIAQFGDINLDPQSVFGQEIGTLSKTFADFWENLDDVYLSQYPNSASGASLDNVVQLNGITRLPATQTQVWASCSGLEGTFIPPNSIAQIPSTGENFYANLGGIITRQSADQIIATIQAIAAQAYIITVNNAAYNFSLPILTFTNSGAIFVTGNIITVVLNGVALAPVNFTIDSDTTLAAIASRIAGVTSLVASATAVNPATINIVPAAGKTVTIQTPVLITGGASQASSAITYASPSNNNQITAGLTAILNQNTPPWTAVDNMNGTLTITTNNEAKPFSLNVGTNISITYQSSPINFLAQNFGPIPCPVNSLTQIVTPIGGWQTVNNLQAGVTGLNAETDAQLRLRRQNSLNLLGLATVDSIEAHLLQDVPGVTSAVVFENRTLTQLPITIAFPDAFVSGDVITVTYDTLDSFTVNFTTNQATTMALIVDQFELIPAVASASYGGTGNQTVTVNMNVLTQLIVNTASASVSVQSAIISGGRPQKSFEAVVEGGTDAAVANEIWLTKPAGIETFGNTQVTIVDSQGNNQVIFFSRPTPFYIWVEVALTLYPEETFPANGTQLVAQAIYNYGTSLGVGINVLFQRVLAQIFTVPGIASGNMEIAATLAPTDTPSYSTSDIVINDTQISVWNLENIFVTVV